MAGRQQRHPVSVLRRTVLVGWLLVAGAMPGVVSDVRAADPPTTLDEAALRALFTDTTVRARHVLHGYDFDRYYAADGTFRSLTRGASVPDHGTWTVEQGQFCIRWEGFNQSLCRHVVVYPDGRHEKVLKLDRGGRKGKVKRIVRYQAFERGNPDGL